MREYAARFIRERRAELVRLLSDLIAARSVNPPGDEYLAAEVARKCFEQYGIPFETHEPEPGRTNLVGRVGEGRPRLLIACHLDVVPPGDDWSTDPFEAVVRDGRVYGRGACDNKGPMASMLLAGACLKQVEEQLEGELLLVCAADEERGSEAGIEYLLREGRIAADMGIIPDVAQNLRACDVAEKGAAFIEIVTHGKQAHGSEPDKGVNAIWHMIHFLSKLKGAELPSVEHRLLSGPTLNLGGLSGGSAPNIVPALCKAQIDIRYQPGVAFEDICGLVERLLREAEEETGGSFEMNVVSDLAPTEVEADSPLFRALAEATGEVTGAPAEAGGMSGATLAKQMILHGIPAVGCGPGDWRDLHASNESVAIAELLDFAQILILAVWRLIGPTDGNPSPS